MNKKKFFKFAACMVVIATVMSVTAFAVESVDVASMLSSVETAMADFSVANLTSIFVKGIGVAVGLAIFWFAGRYLVRKLMGAFRKGRVG